MKAALVTYSDQGGAGMACRRLHLALRARTDCESTMVVRSKRQLFPGVRTAVRPAGTLTAWLDNGRQLAWKKIFPQPEAGGGLARNLHDDGFALRGIDSIAPDVVNLHWLSEEFLSVPSLSRIATPMVWTLHDMWAFTGGCYYSGDCRRFADGCGRCPLVPGGGRDFTAADFARKRGALAGKALTIVTPSRWLAAEAAKSAILRPFPITVIPNSVDTGRFRPLPRPAAREVFGLPQDKTILLFGCSGGTRDQRKGFDLLRDALAHLAGTRGLADVELAVFGLHFDPCDLPLPVHFTGELHDEQSLALLYSAADAMIIPSRQDNLPNTALEAVSCGLPCVAFAIGGMPDIIRPGINGVLAEAVTGEALARAIRDVLAPGEGREALRSTARNDAVARYAPAVQADAYTELFHRITGKP
ncbi:MAG TPA: glycosyltransferase [Terrimicrobiaceae bacterium]|nr:glycosyltransferase [Terrimicrobiaceae bacterium]